MAGIFNLDEHEPTPKPIVTSEFVLNQIDDVVIFRHYLGNFKLGMKFKHPYRKDSNPSFAVFFGTKLLKLMYKDFGTDESGDCFKLVSKLFGLTYSEAVVKVAGDFGLIGDRIITKKQMQEATQFKEEFKAKEYLIQVDIRKMNTEELAYWAQFGITKEDLNKDHIYAINKLWINKNKMILNPNKLHFAYHFPKIGKWKIYSPDDEEKKWFGNVPNTTMEGIEDIPDMPISVIITKSRKDRIILSKIYPVVCSCQNEAEASIPKEMDEYFDEHFKNKYCWFDSDEPGKKANMKLNHRGYKWINTPNELYNTLGLKDPGDIIKHFGVEEGQKVLVTELFKKGILKL